MDLDGYATAGSDPARTIELDMAAGWSGHHGTALTGYLRPVRRP